ncbi:MAG: ubiquitin [Firmicutes bacterium HGW-Firmicutes-20]|nr:MAG: ubiquitin [Firmicutes bacterium HGW-Firmicutes-20]PKM89845.1 MAG: ubiquitin [Firmicutes bacterium HGW-Firmicutes-10]
MIKSNYILDCYNGFNQKERIKSMITIEQVEKLRKYTGVSYTLAKEALEETDGDLLEAVILLEKQQKLQPQSEKTNVRSDHVEEEKVVEDKKKERKDSEANETFREFIRFIKDLLHKGNTNRFDVVKDKKVVMMIPMTLFVILILFAFWFMLPLLIIGLFFGYGYRFSGTDLEKTNVNEAVEKVSDVTLKAGEIVAKAASDLSKELNQKKDE